MIIMSVKRHIQKFFSSYIVVTVRFIGGGTRVPYENHRPVAASLKITHQN